MRTGHLSFYVCIVYIIVIAIVMISLVAVAEGSEDLSDIERDALALELYIQDKSDHEQYCPFITWEQPDIDVYKKTLESQLPDGCEKEQR